MPLSRDQVQVIAAREVPLGGIRALTVRRTLPHRDRSFVGAWCFVDHYGPTSVGEGNDGGMDVPPHPHAGLQTVSWLFAGEIEHRDSGGVIGLVRPGEVNLMTAGHGIAHSEVSTAAASVLHGVQLWVVLPAEHRDTDRDFQHYAPPRVDLPGQAGTALVFLGKLKDVGSSPVTTFTPLLGAQLDLAANARVELALNANHEHAVLVDSGEVTLHDEPLQPGDLGCLDPGAHSLDLRAGGGGARLVLIGGEPYEEEIIMWWNLVGRTHEEIVEQRDLWESGSARFGEVPGYHGVTSRVPAPGLPTTRLKPRRRLPKP